MNKILCLSLFFLLSAALTACFDRANSRKYTIRTYFTSFDSTSSKKGQRFNYSYEIYNVDSNRIYREQYVSPTDPDKDWGKLSERSTIVYKGRQKEKEIRVHGLALPEKEWGTVVYKYGRDSMDRKEPDGLNANFYDSSKNFYDRLARKKRTEFYARRKLIFVFDYRYAE
jgi:hypothetical protein